MKSPRPVWAGAIMAAALCGIVLPGTAQAQALDTGAYLEAVQEVSVFMAVVAECPLAGYTGSAESMEQVVYDTIAQAVAGGMTHDMAESMLLNSYKLTSMNEQFEALDYKLAFERAARSGNAAATDKAARAWFDLVDGKCAELAKMPRFRPVLTAPQESGFELFKRIKTKDLAEE